MATRIVTRPYAKSQAISEQFARNMLDVGWLKASLPNVGDVLKLKPTIFGYGGVRLLTKPCECVVTYVNREHLWYEVLFKELGFKEGFKLPEVKHYL